MDISILFFVNDQNALRHYFNLTVRLVADNSDSSGIMPKDVDKYDNLNELYLFPSLFELIYTPSAFGTIYLYEARKLMSYLTENFSKMDGGYEKLKDVLTKIKNRIENTASGDELDHKLFYINELIEISNNSHIKSKSEGLPFDKDFRFVKE